MTTEKIMNVDALYEELKKLREQGKGSAEIIVWASMCKRTVGSVELDEYTGEKTPSVTFNLEIQG
jgi:hypothetical protein